jgi:hypothetical protein
MEDNMNTNQPLFPRTITKEEALKRRRRILIENSDVPANSVSIKNAVSKAMAEMQEQLDFYIRTKKE